ncbi:MAG: hypothetical protein H6659_03780 [Ardenticatenaceae bacterium]|nr:hypothetical protein [Ardenticatenaceae bacterium]MCB8986380.1 hypothetical protein [Ardenticatenaceae bacterium]
MEMISLLQAEAEKRGLLPEGTAVDAATAFRLVRDMPYIRASSRAPETTVREWRGTCSGKHYLLKALFAEMGIPAQLIACTSVTLLDPETLPPVLREIMIAGNGRFVDVHNYLVLQLPDGEMIVDATWPLSAQGTGLVVNESFVLGEDQEIAFTPQQTWVVPDDEDPQDFKDRLLTAHFTAEELATREAFIQAMSELFKAASDS